MEASVVIPALRAARSLGASVRSALAESEVREVVVAVGGEGSTPPQATDTWQVARSLAREDPRVRVVANPVGTTPSGLNRAIEATSEDTIVRLDAHAVLPPGYVRRAQEVLASTGAANVGGRQRPVGSSVAQRGVASAMRSRIGSGGAAYRVGDRAGPADTVYLGVFLRRALVEVGGFDERMIRNQDAELNLRLREAGWEVWYDPVLSVDYEPRATLPDLASQYFQYGRWRRLTVRLHPGSVRPRQMIPPAAVLLGVAVATLVLVGLLQAWLLALVVLGYLTVVGVGTRRESENLSVWFTATVAVMTMHAAWGVGFLLGPPRGASDAPRGGIRE